MNWRAWFRRRGRHQAEEDLDTEIRFHLEMETESLQRQGLSPPEARRRALRDFGGVQRAKEDTRDVWIGWWMRDAARDFRLALRWLRREPGFAVTAILTIALVIGANAAVFGVVRQVLFAPLPYPGAERLVVVWHGTTTGGGARVRPWAPDVAAYRSRSRTLQDIAFVGVPFDAALGVGTEGGYARVGVVSGNVFSTLGVEALRGRVFHPAEVVVPRESVGDTTFVAPPLPLVLSHGYWQRRFGGREDVIGNTVRVNRQPAVVIGVLPASFALRLPPTAGFDGDADIWSPVQVDLDLLRRADRRQDQDTDNSGVVIARLAPGMTPAGAEDELQSLAATVALETPGRIAPTVEVVGLRTDLVSANRPAFLLLQVAVIVVLLIASLNLTNLLLARSVYRERETALRATLGATRGRLVRQSLVEGGVVAGLGGVGGVLIGAALVSLWPRMAGGVAATPVQLDPGVLIFTAAVTVLVALVAGAGPAVALNAPGYEAAVRRRLLVRSGSGGGARLREGVVVLEIGLTVALMAAAGLILRSVAELHRIDPGFESANRVVFDITLTDGAIGGPGARARFMSTFRERVTALPGVESVGLTGGLPLSGRTWTQPFGFDGDPPAAWQRNEANFRVVTSDYLPTMGVQLLAGRHFTLEEDLREDDRVVIIDATLAARFPGTEPPIGQRMGIPLDGREVWAEIVGVVEPVRHESLRLPGRQTIYVPYRQEATRSVALVVRTRADPALLGSAVRGVLAELGRDLEFPLHGFRRLDEVVATEMAPVRLAMQALGAFAGLTMILAAVGLYGVIAYQVSRRRWEIGLRLAIGATRTGIVVRTLGRTLVLAAAGVGVGLLAAGAGAGLMRSLLVNVEPWDPAAFAAAAVIFATVALAASAIPAARAGRVDPMEALRAE